jgi:nitrile hydratase accessory protein
LSGPEAAFRPREPEPGSPVFAEPWHAEVLAMACSLAREGLFSPAEWAQALGAERRLDVAAGRPDTEAAYYEAALRALESLVSGRSPEVGASLPPRVEAWRRAYLNTPHGRPVTLDAADGPDPGRHHEDHGGHDHHGHDH